MASFKTKARLKRQKQGHTIPNLDKDLKELFRGPYMSFHGKQAAIQAYVQARGM
jgi:hypothetical protein